MKKKIISSLLSLALIITTLSGFACSKQSLISNADDVLFSVRQAKPLIEQFYPAAAAKMDQAISIAQKLRDGIANNDIDSAVGYLDALIPVFQDIVNNDIPQIKDANTRLIILSALALADIALHYLAKNLQEKTPSLVPRGGNIERFNATESWGTKLKVQKRN